MVRVVQIGLVVGVSAVRVAGYSGLAGGAGGGVGELTYYGVGVVRACGR